MLSLADVCLVYLTDVPYGAERRGAVGRSVGRPPRDFTYGAERRRGSVLTAQSAVAAQSAALFSKTSGPLMLSSRQDV